MQTIKFKHLLLDKGVSQRSLARLLNITPGALCRKIKGETNFSYIEVVKLCDFLKIENPRDFFL